MNLMIYSIMMRKINSKEQNLQQSIIAFIDMVLRSHQNEEEDNTVEEEEAKSVMDITKSVDQINGNQQENCLIS